MTRVACLFVLIAVGAVTALAFEPVGKTAIVFSFIGMPSLVLGIAIYGLQRWREGALWGNDTSGKETP